MLPLVVAWQRRSPLKSHNNVQRPLSAGVFIADYEGKT